MKINVAIVNAFVDADGGGNPAGVVLDADNLTHDQKLEVAQKVGLSETAFVSKSDIADFKLDFYTPTRQIAHCGHATIATFSYLSQLGRVPQPKSSKETIDGPRAIEVQDNFAFMEQTAPQYQEVNAELSDVLSSLGISEDVIIAQPTIVNTGNSFLLLGVKSVDDLKGLSPDYKKIEALSDKWDLIGFYIFTLETHKPGRDASTRMFAPRYGIQEESATGMAAGPLACFLNDVMQLNQDEFSIEQGYSMQPSSPSCIKVILSKDNGVIQNLKAGGIGVTSRLESVEISI